MILLKIKGDFEKIKFRSPFTINETNHFIKRSCLKVNFSLPYRYLLIDFIDLLWFPEKWKPFEDFWYELTIKFQVFLISITFLNFPVALIYVKWNFTHLFFEFPFYSKKNQSRAFFHDWQCSIKLSIGVGEKLVKNLIEPESRIKFHIRFRVYLWSISTNLLLHYRIPRLSEQMLLQTGSWFSVKCLSVEMSKVSFHLRISKRRFKAPNERHYEQLLIEQSCFQAITALQERQIENGAWWLIAILIS